MVEELRNFTNGRSIA